MSGISGEEPRVRITYDLEVEPLVEVRELAFVVGVLADLSGQPREGLAPLREREFVAIDRDNFDQVRAATCPRQAGPLVEATWRGLHYLVSNTETSGTLQVRVLDASKEELRRDFAKAGTVEASALYRKVCAEVDGTFGADPYGVLIGDYEFGCEREEVELLRSIAGVAAAAHAPFIAAAGPQMFGRRRFTELENAGDLSKLFEGEAYGAWREFRRSEEARQACLVMPRVVLRQPEGERDEPLLGNAAYVFGARLTEAFRRYHWCSAIRGVEGGGLVEDLPAGKCPTEIPVTEVTDHQFGASLSRLGFTPLYHCTGTNLAVFFDASSCRQAPEDARDKDDSAARLLAELPYTLAVSRFAHYLKALVRDKFGPPMSREECERYLNGWISQYVQRGEGASAESQALRPLGEARIEVTDRPGRRTAIAWLQPRFQLCGAVGLDLPLRVEVELPPPV